MDVISYFIKLISYKSSIAYFCLSLLNFESRYNWLQKYINKIKVNKGRPSLLERDVKCYFKTFCIRSRTRLAFTNLVLDLMKNVQGCGPSWSNHLLWWAWPATLYVSKSQKKTACMNILKNCGVRWIQVILINLISYETMSGRKITK